MIIERYIVNNVLKPISVEGFSFDTHVKKVFGGVLYNLSHSQEYKLVTLSWTIVILYSEISPYPTSRCLVMFCIISRHSQEYKLVTLTWTTVMLYSEIYPYPKPKTNNVSKLARLE